MSSRDEYDEDAPRPRRRKRSEESEPQDYGESSPPPSPKRKRSPRLDDENEQYAAEPKLPKRKRSPRLADEAEEAPSTKKPRRKVAQAPAQPAKRSKSAKQEKPKQPPVNRGKWRNATLHERILRIRWIMGLLYRYAPAWLVAVILIALFGPNLLRSMRNGLMPPLIAPFYTPSVQYWAPKLSQWATEYDVNPNLIATLMQIESCGYPGATSTAGAQGLFQVMPMNFAENTTNMTDPETNAKAGITVIRDCLRYADGDVGLAMACYNGGPSLISRPPETWPEESLRYYTWGTGIYNDAVRGLDKSETLDSWLQSGGQYLCAKASQTLGIATTQFTQAAPTTLFQPPTVSLSTGGQSSPARATPLTAVPTINIQSPNAVTPTPGVKLFLTPTQQDR
jgi:soluble lytic murein transglycosylase-like protein